MWNNVVIDGDRVGAAMVKWYASLDDPAATKKVWNRNAVYPCSSCCKA